MTDPRRIVLLVQQPCLRLGLAQALKAHPETSALVILEAGDPETACALVEANKPALVIADISGARTSPVELARFTRCAEVAPKVLVISPYDQPYLVQQAFEAKASGYILASATTEELAKAVTTVLSGGYYLDPALVSRVVGCSQHPEDPIDPSAITRSIVKATPREIDVLKRFAHGYSAKEIARELEISQKSVETYKARGAAKLHLESRAQIVRFANDAGWFAPLH